LFGPLVSESLVGARLFGPLLAGKSAQIFANLDAPHSVSFVRDIARALVTVGAHDAALGRAWHAPNAPAVTLRQLIEIIGEEAGVTPQVRALPRRVTRALLPALGLFVPPLRGLSENLYIGYEPYIVDHRAYADMFGDHATPLRDAIRETVQWFRASAASSWAAQS
jgi:nucleoside-diphosphate-sugar epimerase